MSLDKLVDWLAPIIGLLVAAEHREQLTRGLRRVRNWTSVQAAKLEGWMTHDLVAFFCGARARMLVAELVLLLAAIGVFFLASGYCGPVAMPIALLALLIPVGFTFIRGAFAVLRDWGVKPLPFHFAEGKATPSSLPIVILEVPVAPPANPPIAPIAPVAPTAPPAGAPQPLVDAYNVQMTAHNAALTAHATRLAEHATLEAGYRTRVAEHAVAVMAYNAQRNDPAHEARINEYEAAIRAEAPHDRSPIPHMWALIWSPVITAVSLLALALGMGYYGTFSLTGLVRFWPMVMGLLALAAFVLAGVGYKLVLGVGRSLALIFADAAGPGLTFFTRFLATGLPEITWDNVKEKIGPISLQMIRAFAEASEKVENRPIATIFLVFAVCAALPHPFTLFAMVIVGVLVKGSFGNQEAEAIDTTVQRQTDAKALDPWLRRLGVVVLIAVALLSFFRDALVAMLGAVAGVLNPFFRLGLPSGAYPRWYEWILPVLVPIIIMYFLWEVATAKGLNERLKKTLQSLVIAMVLMLSFNLVRATTGAASAMQISDVSLASALACPVPPPAPAPVVVPATTPPLPTGTVVAAPPAPAPAQTPVPVPAVVDPVVDPSPPVVAPAPERARRRRTASRTNGPSGWTDEERAVLESGGYSTE